MLIMGGLVAASEYLKELDHIIEKYVGKYERETKREVASKAYFELLTRQIGIEEYLRQRVAQLKSPLTSEIAQIADPFERYFARLPAEARPVSIKITQKLQNGPIVRIRYDRRMILQFIALGGNLLKETPDEKLPRPGREYFIKAISKPTDLMNSSSLDKFNYGIFLSLERVNETVGMIEMNGLYGVSWIANEEPGVQTRGRF